MSLIKKIKAVFNEAEENKEETSMEFVDVKTKDGRIMRVPDLAVEAPVVEITEDGEVAVEDGDYELEDGTVLKVVGGLIAEIMPAAEEDEDGEVVTEEMNKTEKFYDVFLKNGGKAHVINTEEGKMNEGDKMVIEGEEAAPGEYELNSGETLTVGEEGVIDSIKTADETVEDDAKNAAEEAVEEADEEVQGIVNNLKDLVKQIKDLKSQFEKIENENKELKEQFSKFADAPSDEPTNTKVDFKAASKEEKLKFFRKRG